MEEGEKRTITQECQREKCEECSEPATHQLTFLYPNARSNPASSAYRHDDCSWCADKKVFMCDGHEKDKYKIARELGMGWCADFPYERFKRLFLKWKTIEENPK